MLNLGSKREDLFVGNFVVNTLLKGMDFFFVLCKFAMNRVVLDIGNRDVILGLSW